MRPGVGVLLWALNVAEVTPQPLGRLGNVKNTNDGWFWLPDFDLTNRLESVPLFSLGARF